MEPQARMTSAARSFGEPPEVHGPIDSATRHRVLEGAIAIAREWTGGRHEALVLSGSHAAGEGVWCTWQGRPVTLSDLDLYAILSDDGAVRATQARARDARAGLAGRLLALGVAAPLEVAALTRAGLARVAARPGTIDLARSGRVIEGDPGVLDALPRFAVRDVSREELLLLLENRGFELLLAHPDLAAADELARLRARHALLKAAADLAAVLALAHGELPAGAAARMAWARGQALPSLAAALPLEHQRGARALDALWDAAAAWRAGDVHALAADDAIAEWTDVARAWCAVWWAAHPDAPREPWARVLRVASRAPIRRRARQALLAASRGGATAPLGSRLRAALTGTPQHRVNGSATVLLLAAATSASVPALPAGALRALRVLDVTRAADWNAARREVVRAWDVWLHDGQRTAEDA